MLEESRKQAEEKVQAILQENELHIKQLEKNNENYIALVKDQVNQQIKAIQLENESKKAAIIAAIDNLNLRKQHLEESLAQLQNEVSSYEKAVIKTKFRILQRVKAERELELANLKECYRIMMEETAEAVQLIQSKMAEWSRIERAAYEERIGREESESRNKLSLSSRTVDELRELYNACDKLHLSNPTPLYKALYEIYFRGPVKDLGVRLGATGQCGIYKITNVLSGKVYVGQSVDIAERWKQHIKRGCKCDAGTLSGAGLYEAMWEDGVWNFSFQILELCEKSELNSHEKMWISHFQSNEIGYNKKC